MYLTNIYYVLNVNGTREAMSVNETSYTFTSSQVPPERKQFHSTQYVPFSYLNLPNLLKMSKSQLSNVLTK